MKKIISLIILSIIFKGYFSDTENLCSEVNQNFETACPAAVTNDPKKKCTYTSGEACSEIDKNCEEITVGASDEICSSVHVDDDNACMYKDNQCKIVGLCLKVSSPENEADCTSVPASDQKIMKCILKTDENGLKKPKNA